MSIFSMTPARRTPHHEPGFNDADYVAEYSEETRKHAGAEHEALLKFISERFRDGARMEALDISTGPGWLPIRLAQRNPGMRVIGIDVSPEFLAIANRNKDREGVGDRVEFIEGDTESLDRFAERSFDFVVSNQSLHYWPSPEAVFDQIARLLRADGAFCLSDDRRDLTLLGRLQVVMARRILSERIGTSWRRSLDGCFSSNEVATMLQQSALRDRWKMSLSSRGMLITS